MSAEPEVPEARGGHRPDWKAVKPGTALKDLRDSQGVELADDGAGQAGEAQ